MNSYNAADENIVHRIRLPCTNHFFWENANVDMACIYAHLTMLLNAPQHTTQKRFTETLNKF